MYKPTENPTCEICSDDGTTTDARHAYIYVGPPERYHYYCNNHFYEFCILALEKVKIRRDDNG